MSELTVDTLSRDMQASRPQSLAMWLIRLARSYPCFLPELLKLIDAASAVSSPSRYFYASLRGSPHALPQAAHYAFRASELLVPPKVCDTAIKLIIERVVASHFLLRNERDFEVIRSRYKREGAGIILDVIGEEALLSEQADAFYASYANVIERYGGNGGKVALKLSSLTPSLAFSTPSYSANKRMLKEKLVSILTLATKNHTQLTLDAEEYFKWCRLNEDVFCETVLEEPWRTMTSIGIALQAYRTDALASAETLLATARKRGTPIGVRVVKGAYWDTERAIAEQNGWTFPLFTRQEDTDNNFDRVVAYLLDHHEHFNVYPATHNPRSIATSWRKALETYPRTRPNSTQFEFQVLYGLGESARRSLCRAGIPVSVYAPLIRDGGSVTEGLAYLVRRMLETTNSHLVSTL